MNIPFGVVKCSLKSEKSYLIEWLVDKLFYAAHILEFSFFSIQIFRIEY